MNAPVIESGDMVIIPSSPNRIRKPDPKANMESSISGTVMVDGDSPCECSVAWPLGPANVMYHMRNM